MPNAKEIRHANEALQAADREEARALDYHAAKHREAAAAEEAAAKLRASAEKPYASTVIGLRVA
jgi:hypothetical protein